MSDPNPTTPSLRYRYLLGALQQLALQDTVLRMCIPQEAARLGEISEAWRQASARMSELANTERGEPEKIQVSNLPTSVDDHLATISSDQLFKLSFASLPFNFKVVEIARLVAPQREVNLDYVNSLKQRIPGRAPEDLLDFCIGAHADPPPILKLQNQSNQITFTSRSFDLRFLGGFPKLLTQADIDVAHNGGQPTEVASLLVGFGASPINAFLANGRIVLNNGFHRTVALYDAGIRHMPIVLMQVTNKEIDFPNQLQGLSRAYLLDSQRPVMLKDFFDSALTLDLRLRPRRKMVKITWSFEDGIIPE